MNTTEAVVPPDPFVLDQVLITGELDARPSRAPDLEAENRALSTLAEALAASPQTVLQKLAEIVLELCRAESAGISILEYHGDTPVFRWRAAAGAFSANIGGTMPRDASPCGTVIERNAVLLFDRAERHFPALRGVEPRIYENLLAPFQLDGRPAGTVWAIRHDPEGSFDREDARLLGSLARFAAAAYQTVIAREKAEAARQELQRTADARVRSAAARSEQLGKLFEAAPGFMAVVRGPEYVFELANPAYYQLVGHRDIVGKTLLEALPEVEGQGFRQMLNRVMQTGRPFVGHDIPVRLQRERGGALEERYVHFVYQPLIETDGGVSGIFIEGIDTTEHKRAEIALYRTEERYRTLFESIDEGFCVIEVLFEDDGTPCDYRFVEINPAFEKQTGLLQARGKRMRELAPEHEQHWFDIYGKVATTGESARFESQASALRRWFDVYAFRVGHAGARRVAVLFTDITQRKRSEAALQEADRRKDEFIATLAHELRNPLAPIRNAVHFMRIRGVSDPALQNAREIIERQLQHLMRLVDDLLEVSRITRGRIDLHKERVSVDLVVTTALEAVQTDIESAGHELTVDLPAVPLYLDADLTRISQILVNLLNNAAKYTPAHGHIRLSARAAADTVLISIRDDGIGIAPAQLEHIFELFSQLDRAARHDAGGLGIGLSISRQLARLHGGDIEARSQGIGRGSEFTVRLPQSAVPRKPVAPSEERADDTPHTAPRRILVVDDNVDAADTLAVNLQLDGHSTQTAYEGRAALAAIESFGPEVVLLDIGMPELDGYEVARRIRSTPRGSELLLVALTGWGQDEDKRQAAEAGFDHHLTKPIDPTRLRSMLHSS